MINVALIGAGQLGSRHLQALTKIDADCIFQVVDPNPTSLNTAKQRINEIPQASDFDISVEYYNDISEIHHEIDVAIIATNSDVRREIIEKLVLYTEVKNIILEKVLFQNVDDFFSVQNLLHEKKIKAWVNHPCRIYPYYIKLRDLLKNSTVHEMHVIGSLWGLGCNAIHMIDLLAFLCGSTEYEVFTDLLDIDIIPSKRPGFIEFTGELHGKFSNGSMFNIASFKTGELPTMVQIFGSSLQCLIRENERKAWISMKENAWQWQEEDYQIPYQSQLTHLVVHDILSTGECGLTPFDESVKLNLPLIKAFIGHLQKLNPSKVITHCPIT